MEGECTGLALPDQSGGSGAGLLRRMARVQPRSAVCDRKSTTALTIDTCGTPLRHLEQPQIQLLR